LAIVSSFARDAKTPRIFANAIDAGLAVAGLW